MRTTVALPRDPTGPADWPVLTVDRLDRESVRALLGNRVAAIRRPGILDADTCAESIEVLQASDAWDSYAVDGPPTGKLGISQYSYGADKDRYFADAATALDRRARVVAAIPDPLRLVQAELAAAWDGPVRVAHEAGRPYFAGVFRSGAGIRLHADWAPRDGAGWMIGDVVAQLAWNLYYAKPGTGGELVVYDRSWTPDLELGAKQRFYDYDPAAVRDSRRVEITFAAGDVVLFSSSNVHEVADSPDGATRVTASSFVGEHPDGSLLLWS